MYLVLFPMFLILCNQGEEKKVYEFIARHFLACCSQDAKGFETTCEINIATEKVSVHIYARSTLILLVQS